MPPPATPSADFDRVARPLPLPLPVPRRPATLAPASRRSSLQRDLRDTDFLRRLRESGL